MRRWSRLTATLLLADHRLRFLNAHRADISVYLANALAPEGTLVDVIAQRRAADQRQLEIDYVLRGVAPARPSLLPPAVAAIALLVAVTWISRGQRRPPVTSETSSSSSRL
ncbi:MAG TPA: hypothetical protein VJN96_21055 [Vicinamibacterales bacterium]|nr:hypothetical protein [Vicinamibacterales bacterium]